MGGQRKSRERIELVAVRADDLAFIGQVVRTAISKMTTKKIKDLFTFPGWVSESIRLLRERSEKIDSVAERLLRSEQALWQIINDLARADQTVRQSRNQALESGRILQQSIEALTARFQNLDKALFAEGFGRGTELTPTLRDRFKEFLPLHLLVGCRVVPSGFEKAFQLGEALSSGHALTLREGSGSEIDFSEDERCAIFPLARLSRAELYGAASRVLGDLQVSQIIAIPATTGDLRLAATVADVTGASMLVYFAAAEPLQDPDGLSQASKVIQKATICCAGTERIRAYLQKLFGKRIWLVPPLVGKASRLSGSPKPDPGAPQSLVVAGYLAGSDFGEKIAPVARAGGLEVQAFLSLNGFDVSDCSRHPADASAAPRFTNICPGFLEAVRRADLVILIPRSDSRESRQPDSDFLFLSLSIYLLSETRVPQFVLSTPDNEVAEVVAKLGIGMAVAPNPDQLIISINETVTSGDFDSAQKKIAAVTEALAVDSGIAWINDAVAQERAIHNAYEKLFQPTVDLLTPFINPDAPKDVYWGFIPQLQALYRLQLQGFDPDFVVDVGASTGVWSHYAAKVFPRPKYYLLEPLLDLYAKHGGGIYQMHPEFVKLPCAAGARSEVKEFHVSKDLYGSSFFEELSVPGGRIHDSVSVRICTLDEIAGQHSITGRGLLKIDTQCTEHLVIAGAERFLGQVDIIVVEVSLPRLARGSKTFPEILELLAQRGFQYYDVAGEWRDTVTGQMVQQDAVFAKREFASKFLSKDLQAG
jgi:FkbM family methyltransferase